MKYSDKIEHYFRKMKEMLLTSLLKAKKQPQKTGIKLMRQIKVAEFEMRVQLEREHTISEFAQLGMIDPQKKNSKEKAIESVRRFDFHV